MLNLCYNIQNIIEVCRGDWMISYEIFFLFVLVGILGPVVGVLLIIFRLMLDQKVFYLETENRRIFLEKELHRSEYQQLTQQIEPHFLFNALNSLLTLARFNRTSELIPMFENLVRFLRFTYQEKGQLHTIEKELSHTSNYLSIQKIRFGQRLNVDVHSDQSLEKALIPPYMVQTLVENAFKHGIEQVEGEAELTIHLEKKIQQGRNYIDLKVLDNGNGFTYNPLQVDKSFQQSNQHGIGLENIQKRLELLFKEDYRMEIGLANEEKRGGNVRIVWPLITSESKKQGDDTIEYPVTG